MSCGWGTAGLAPEQDPEGVGTRPCRQSSVTLGLQFCKLFRFCSLFPVGFYRRGAVGTETAGLAMGEEVRCFPLARSSQRHRPHRSSSLWRQHFAPKAPGPSSQNLRTPANASGECLLLRSLNPRSMGQFSGCLGSHVPQLVLCPQTLIARAAPTVSFPMLPAHRFFLPSTQLQPTQRRRPGLKRLRCNHGPFPRRCRSLA